MTQAKSDNGAENPEFKRLFKTPKMAWPTLGLFFACLASLGFIDYHALTGGIPLWVATVLNGIVTYFFFSVVHDSAHGAISSNKRVNDTLGAIGMVFFGPLATIRLACWIHMQHHRFSNDPEKDPDYFGHKIDIFTPLRWLNFDYYYTKFFLQHSGSMRKKLAPRLILQVVFVVAVVAFASVYGYGLEIVMLWLLPTRISSALFVMMFVYLPHAPFFATAKEDEYQASNIRVGWEWLLTPLMAYQNYHLAHHLYPRVPFYRLSAVWQSRLEHHLSNDPFFVKAFEVGKKTEAPNYKGVTK